MKSPVDNPNDENAGALVRRPRGREVSSRYMLPTASSLAASSFGSIISDGFSTPVRRSNSPNSKWQKNGSTGDPKRSASAERRRPAKSAAEEPNAMRGLWPSAANNVPTLADQLGNEKLKRIAVGRIDPVPNPPAPNNTRPKTRRSSQENTKPGSDEYQHNHQKKISGNSPSLSKSTENLSILRGAKSLGRASSSLNLRPRRIASNEADYADRLQAIVPARLSVDSLSFPRRDVDIASSDDAIADSPKPGGASRKNSTRGSFVPARFLQNTLSSLRRLSDTNPKQNLHRSRAPSSGSGSDSSWAGSLASSPAGAKSSNSPRGSAKPRSGNVLSFGMDIFRGRRSAAVQEETIYQLRMLHNRWLQWRFVNARARAAHEAQIVMAEEALFHVWLKASQLRTSVVAKRMELQRARHELKLKTLLAAHALQLEDWATMEREHGSAIIGTMECLEAAILKLPLVGGAKADVRTVMQVLGFAADVTNGIRAAATKILPQAENVNSLLMELVETVAEERALLQECMELLAGVASLQMQENSLRIQLIQLQQSTNQELNNHQSIKLDIVRPNLLDLNHLEF